MSTSKEDDIRDRAYALWQAEGSPEGRGEEFWHRAEQEISGETEVGGSDLGADLAHPDAATGLPKP